MNSTEKGSRKRAIRLKCLDCCCGNAAEVRLCPIQTCPLWRFRMGTESKGKKEAFSGESFEDKSQPTPGEKTP